MAWFGKSSKAEHQPANNDMERLGIIFEPLLFYPDRNEYELSIDLSGCPKDLIKVTYDQSLGKLKLQGQKQKTKFHHQFSVPDDCLHTGIYGTFRGDVLHIVIPRLRSDLPQPDSRDASSKQEDDHQEASSDQKATDEVWEREGKDRDNLSARVPVPPPPPPLLPSDQKTTDEVRERVETERKLPSKVSAPPPSYKNTTEKSKERDEELYPEISAPRPDRESSRSVKELREKYQKKLSEIAAPPPAPPPFDQKTTDNARERLEKNLSAPRPPPPSAAAPTPSPVPATSNWKSTDVGAREEMEEDREPPSTVVPASPSSKSGTKISENAKVVTESKANGTEEKNRSAGGNEKLGLIDTVKETGKAAVAAAWKEENRRVVMIGAAVLAIVVIGAASLRSSNKKIKN